VKLNESRLMLVLVFVLVLIVVIAGAIVTVDGSHALTFTEYIRDVAVIAGALGLGAGIGIARANGRKDDHTGS
jgi:Trk-type K+ transport system membrane component